MRYFVTGGAGFVGSYVVDRLLNRGEVTVYDNLSWGKEEFIEHHLSKDSFHFIKADILDFKVLKETMKGCDVVFHFASGTDIRAGTKDTELDLKNGTIGTYNTLMAMRGNGIKEIVFSSSAALYGEAGNTIIAEDYGPQLPISLYGASKLACEGLISACCHLFDMRSWMFRFSNVVGKRQTHGVIVDFVHKLQQNPTELEILGDGTQERPFFLAEECAEGILFAYDHAKQPVNLFNLGCSSFTNITTVAKIVVEEMGLKGVKFKHTGGKRGWPGDAPVVHFSVKRIGKLGWQAKHTSDEAVRLATRQILGKSN